MNTEELLAEANKLLQALVDDAKARTPEGRVYIQNPYTVPAGGNVQLIDFPGPLFTVTIINDGPVTVQFRIPKTQETEWQDILPTESIPIVFPKAMLTSIALRNVTLVNGVIRMVGTA